MLFMLHVFFIFFFFFSELPSEATHEILLGRVDTLSETDRAVVMTKYRVSNKASS